MVKVVLGGTFDILHRGHKTLLKRAIAEGDEILVGLATDEFAQLRKGRRISSYGERLAALRKFFEENAGEKEYFIFPIDDPYGPATSDGGIEAIVVSEETFEVAEEINRLRSAKGLTGLRVVVVEMVNGEDGRRISASWIRLGEMDEEGRVLQRGK